MVISYLFSNPIGLTANYLTLSTIDHAVQYAGYEECCVFYEECCEFRELF